LGTGKSKADAKRSPVKAPAHRIHKHHHGYFIYLFYFHPSIKSADSRRLPLASKRPRLRTSPPTSALPSPPRLAPPTPSPLSGPGTIHYPLLTGFGSELLPCLYSLSLLSYHHRAILLFTVSSPLPLRPTNASIQLPPLQQME
jgi:hypothetical protein